MPNKTPIEDIKKQLPAFVMIIPESYRGARYQTKFIDIEYNESFEAIPGNVIRLQHGCKSRSNKLRSDALQGVDTKQGTPIESIIERLPAYLDILPDTYISIREKATFYDKEYKCHFEAYVSNVLRDGNGFCQARENNNFKNKITRTAEDIQKELDIKYPNCFKLLNDTYRNTNSIAEFIDLTNNEHFKSYPCQVLGGQRSERKKLYQWRESIKKRDNHTCQICQEQSRIVTHHLYAWKGYPEQRFNLDNGITLCAPCHDHFHSVYGKGQNTLNEFLDHIKQKSETLASLALELAKRIS